MQIARTQVHLRRLFVFGAIISAIFVHPHALSAHPLGNFSINHLSVVNVHRSSIDVRYVLDQAEIPSYTIFRSSTRNGRPTQAFLRQWSDAQQAIIVPQLELTIDGRRVPLKARAAHASVRDGAGGLATIYWVLELNADIPARRNTLRYEDHSYADRLGWKDVVVRPASEPTHELRVYPPALTGSPRAVTTFTTGEPLGAAPSNASSGSGSAATVGSGAVAGSGTAMGRSNQLSDLVSRGTSDFRVVLLTLLVAIGLGALHAIEPGHGKTLMAVSLVGARATVRQACILAGSITFAHTIGVIALGLVILVGAKYIVPELVYPWITLIAGVVIAVLGARSLARYTRANQSLVHSHAHGHPHAHDHHHGDLSDEEHARLHAQAFAGPLTFRGIIFAAMSGGIAPCPAALVVLLTAVTLHHVAYGLAVIVAFSFGLAAVLTGVGITVVRSAAWLSERAEFARFVRFGPLFSALIIALIGAAMVGEGFTQVGVDAPWLIITALTVFAIAAYAVFPHTHAPVRPTPLEMQ